jgi:two-component system, OmpR family, sensor histidine kinase ResE
MSPEHVDKILQSSKINDTTQGTNNEQGHGIGLFISQYFIKKYNGKLDCESTEGKGTTFTISIPKKVPQ